MKCTCFKNRSVVTQITMFPELSGSSTTKSMEISVQGAVGLAIRCKNPCGLPACPFADAHMGQLDTYPSMSFLMLGHQN